MEFPKFIIEGDKLILSRVQYHKQLVTDEKQVKGGGWFRLDKDKTTFTFYGDSHDYGAAKIEDIQECVRKGNVFTNKYSESSIADRYKFAYDTHCEIIPLN